MSMFQPDRNGATGHLSRHHQRGHRDILLFLAIVIVVGTVAIASFLPAMAFARRHPCQVGCQPKARSNAKKPAILPTGTNQPWRT